MIQKDSSVAKQRGKHPSKPHITLELKSSKFQDLISADNAISTHTIIPDKGNFKIAHLKHFPSYKPVFWRPNHSAHLRLCSWV